MILFAIDKFIMPLKSLDGPVFQSKFSVCQSEYWKLFMEEKVTNYIAQCRKLTVFEFSIQFIH